MQAQTTDYGTMDRDGRACSTIETLAQFGVDNNGVQIDFALVAFDGREELMQIRDGKYTTIESYPKTMTAHKAYEAILAHNKSAVVFAK